MHGGFCMGTFILYLLPFGVAALILFYLMKAAVKSALEDIQLQAKKDRKAVRDKKDLNKLTELRDMEILSDTELEKAIESYKSVITNKENSEKYLKYSKILDELKEIGHFNQDQYFEKSNMLKKHFNID
jgi:hypothetical protein